MGLRNGAWMFQWVLKNLMRYRRHVASILTKSTLWRQADTQGFNAHAITSYQHEFKMTTDEK